MSLKLCRHFSVDIKKNNMYNIFRGEYYEKKRRFSCL